MEEDRLSEALRAMVLEHGIQRVEHTLGEIRISAADNAADGRSRASVVRTHKASAGRPKKEKTSASLYVSKLEVSDESRRILEEVAVKFDEKVFFPTFGEIRNFCSIHGVEVPASSSRVSAVPRIFKHLARLSPQELRAILQDGSFSGPSRLAPIADAIRRSSEQRMGIRGSVHRRPDSPSEVTETNRESSAKPPVPSSI